MRRYLWSAALCCAALAGSAVTVHAESPPPISLAFDTREIARDVLHVHETIAVSGPLTLVFPKWIPGEHGPEGQILNLVNLRMTAAGKPVDFVRDRRDNFAFHVAVPRGATQLDLTFDHIYAPQGDSTTPNMATVNWVDGVLYPAGSNIYQLMVAPSITLPADMQDGTALQTTSTHGSTQTFAPVSLGTLVDSPVIMSRYLRKITLWSGDGHINEAVLAADSPKDLELKASTIADMKQMVVQTDAAFGARHWVNYHFLIALADPIAHFGLEHHESSDDRLPENSLTDDNATSIRTRGTASIAVPRASRRRITKSRCAMNCCGSTKV
jgi:predicted metalloprotease with PDZ domain